MGVQKGKSNGRRFIQCCWFVAVVQACYWGDSGHHTPCGEGRCCLYNSEEIYEYCVNCGDTPVPSPAPTSAPTPALTPASTPASFESSCNGTVSSAADITDLQTNLTRCGDVQVMWQGHVVLDSTITVPSGAVLTVAGGDAESAVIDGAGAVQLFNVSGGGSLHLSDLLLTGGFTAYRGGAVGLEGAIASFNTCTFSNNSASDAGGGLSVDSGSNATMDTCTFSNNSVIYYDGGDAGGGVSVDRGSTATMELCTFTGNSAGEGNGGGVSVDSGSNANMKTCTFSNNSGGDGGGVRVSYSTATVESCNFTGNSAGGSWDDGGGGVSVSDSSTATVESCTFTGNSAGYGLGDGHGGGVRVSDSSTATVESCTFTGNSANVGGGGVGVYYGSIATMKSCTFTNNSAGDYGGGVEVTASNVTMELCNFTNNSAGYNVTSAGYIFYGRGYGGGMDVTGSNVTMESCTFTGNSVGGDGGGVRVYDVSTTTVESCTFTGNSVGGDGGGVYVSDSSTATVESCNFTGNSVGGDGGGVYVASPAGYTVGVYYSSNATMESCTFTDNSASNYGGGVFVFDNSTATMGSCTFTGNSASSYGGGVYVYSNSNATIESCTFIGNSASDGGGVYVSDGSTATMESCSFTGNSASSYGGGVSVVDSSTATMDTCTFTHNSASSYGGGVYLYSSSTATMNTCTFSDNSASYGGGMYVYSGSTVTMDACTVTHNSANNDGGGIASVYDPATQTDSTLTIRSCNFTFNVAVYGNGGAVSSSSQVEDDSSHFVMNKAGTAGGAVFMSLDWTWSAEWGTRFSNNMVACCYSPSESAAYNCSDVNGQRTGENICCGASTTFKVTGNSEPTCSACPVGYNCDDPGARPLVLGGYWIALNYSLDNRTTAPPEARECWFSDACEGGDPLDQSKLCSEHFMGPLCAVCAPGYYSGVGFECRACPAHSRAVVACSIVAILIVVVLGALFVVRDLHGAPVLATSTSSRWSRVWARLRNAPYGKLRIPIVVLQIISQFAATTGIQYPTVYQQFLNVIGVVGFSVDWVGALTCAFSTNFYDYLLLVTVTPLAIVALLALSLFAVWYRTCRPAGLVGPRPSPATAFRESPWERATHKHALVFMLFTFLIYPTVSTAVFQTFACDTEFADGGSYLYADYSISCKTGLHRAYVAYAAVMIFIYPVGIPVLYAGMLYRQRHRIRRTTRETDSSTKKTRFLWVSYALERYWWEVVECVRRLCLTGILVFIMPGALGQSAMACVFAVASLAAAYYFLPHADSSDAHNYNLGCIVIFCSTFLAVLIKAETADPYEQSKFVVAVLLICLSTATVVVAVTQTILGAMGAVNDPLLSNVELSQRVEVKEDVGSDESTRDNGSSESSSVTAGPGAIFA